MYKASREFVFECYRFTKNLPDEEKYAMASQIRRAALSIYLNIAEGASRKSNTERKRFYEIARGSIVEIDAAMDIANDLNYIGKYDTAKMGEKMIAVFKLLSGML